MNRHADLAAVYEDILKNGHGETKETLNLAEELIDRLGLSDTDMIRLKTAMQMKTQTVADWILSRSSL